MAFKVHNEPQEPGNSSYLLFAWNPSIFQPLSTGLLIRICFPACPAELLLHAERVEKHEKGVNQTILDLRVCFTALTEQHEKMVADFTARMDQCAAVLAAATRSNK